MKEHCYGWIHSFRCAIAKAKRARTMDGQNLSRMANRFTHSCLIALVALGVTAGICPRAAANNKADHQPAARLNQWLEKHRQHPNALRSLLQTMPKGADLHTHLSGAMYAEDYLKLAADNGYCFDRRTLSLKEPALCQIDRSALAARELDQHADLYNKILDQWSTRDSVAGGRSGHEDFFKAFQGFSALSSRSDLQGLMVASVANRAASQSIHYLELMITLDGDPVRKLGRDLGWSADTESLRKRLLTQGLEAQVRQGVKTIESIDADRRAALHCLGQKQQSGCKVEVRYIQQANRTQAPSEVFAQLLYAFELAKRSELVVGVNLVGPEDHPIAKRDYQLQMQMLAALRKHYPEVGIALHAGELTRKLATPAEMAFHIREAITVGGARRIGHGVSISYEANARQLMTLIAKLQVLVELCLTSNAIILGVENDDHPLLDYQQAGVATALASDDEGVLRTDLTEQFVLAVRRYGLSYNQLRELARNSLTYSFLPGKSLWATTRKLTPISACAHGQPGSKIIDSRCASFLAGSIKARLQWSLEKDLQQFEQMALNYAN